MAILDKGQLLRVELYFRCRRLSIPQILTFLKFCLAELFPWLSCFIVTQLRIVDRSELCLGHQVAVRARHECAHVEVRAWLDVRLEV